jgi:hypothetical protein
MPDDMDEAAQAFDAEISSEQRGNPPAPKEEKAEKPTDRMFKNLGNLEVDDESPDKGGGDDDSDPDEVIYAKRDAPEDDGEPEEVEEEEPDEEEESEEDDEKVVEAGDLDLSTKVKVMVDGEEASVPLKEALEGYIRTETFHRRLSEVAENHKVVQAAAAEVVNNYNYAHQLITTMEAQLKELVPPEPDWDKEFEKDPNRARGLQKYYQQVAGFQQKLQEQRNDLIRQQSAHDSTQLKVYAQTEETRFNRINSKMWGTDPARKGKDLQAMRRTALSEGFSEEELSGVFDSRMLQILLKASKYDRIVAARPRPKQVATKSVTPGPGKRSVNATGHKGFTDAMKTLAKTGSLEAAGPVFDQIIRRK